MNREDLKNYYDTQEWINDEIELYKEQKQRAEGLRSPIIDGLPKPKDKPNYAIEELIDCYNAILNQLYKLQSRQNEIVLQLEKMPNATYRRILFLKYIKGLELEDIAIKIKQKYKHTCNLHGYALIEFDNLEKKLNNGNTGEK